MAKQWYPSIATLLIIASLSSCGGESIGGGVSQPVQKTEPKQIPVVDIDEHYKIARDIEVYEYVPKSRATVLCITTIYHESASTSCTQQP